MTGEAIRLYCGVALVDAVAGVEKLVGRVGLSRWGPIPPIVVTSPARNRSDWVLAVSPAALRRRNIAILHVDGLFVIFN